MTEESILDRLPEAASAECARFLDSFRDTVDFVFFITQVVTSQDEIQRIAREALLPDADPGDAARLQKELSQGAVVTRELQRFSQLVFEMLVTRAVDSYLTYISDLLSTVFRSRPEMLRSNEQVRIEFVLQHSTMNELTNALAERRVERLSYAGMKELAQNLREALGFKLFDSKDDLTRAVRIVEDRNLIVHNRAIVNRTYLRRVPDAATALGDRLTLDFDSVFGDVEFLADAAIRADARAAAKWALPQLAYRLRSKDDGEAVPSRDPTPESRSPES